MRRTPGGKLSFRLPLVKNSGVVRALVFVVQTLKDGFRFFVAIGGTARELIGDREAEQTQRGLVLGICGKDIPADRFSFTWFVQIAIELSFRDRFGNAVLRNRFELKIYFHLYYLSDFDFNVQAIDANVISAYALTCGRTEHLAGCDIKHCAMPRASDLNTLDLAFAQRPAHVRAGVVDRMVGAVDVEDRNLVTVYLDQLCLA